MTQDPNIMKELLSMEARNGERHTETVELIAAVKSDVAEAKFETVTAAIRLDALTDVVGENTDRSKASATTLQELTLYKRLLKWSLGPIIAFVTATAVWGGRFVDWVGSFTKGS